MSGLPENNTPWPPPGHAGRYATMATCSAWYAGDPAKLAAAYGFGTESAAVVTSNGFRAAARRLGSGFWHDPAPQSARRHLPIANEIASRSADLLFSDPPTFTIDAEPDADGNPTPDVIAAQQRLDGILDASNVEALLLQAAEVQAALGSAVLRIAYDATGPAGDVPLLTVVHADAAVPSYRWGQLVGVTLWRTLGGRTEQDVYRHLEHHEGGYVEHGLYQGTPDRLGKRVPLTEHPSTAELAVDEDSRILLDPRGGLTAISVPNMLPDPLDRTSQVGRSDYTGPVIDLMDAADAVYTRMLEHIDDSRSRIIIAEALLTRRGAGQGVEFDMGQRVFTKVKYPASENQTGLPIEKVQFDMKVVEHLQALDSLQQRAIQAAGYSTRTDQGSDGEAMTATEVGATERKSLSTRDRKLRYWRPALARLVTTMLSVDAHLFPAVAAVGGPFTVKVSFPEAVQPSPLDLANLATALAASGGASVRTIVGALHPDWDESAVNEEVDRIQNVAPLQDPATFRDELTGL